MRSSTRPAFGRCPSPRHVADGAFAEQLAALREDIHRAGGLDPWLETRLDAWVAGVCPWRRAPHRARRRPRALTFRSGSGRDRSPATALLSRRW